MVDIFGSGSVSLSKLYVFIVELRVLFFLSVQCQYAYVWNCMILYRRTVVSLTHCTLTPQAGSLGSKAIYFYSLTTLLAVLEGILIANLFSFLFASDEGEGDDDDGVEVAMVCPEDFGTMTMARDGSILCVHEDRLNSINISTRYATHFGFLSCKEE